MLSTLKAEIDEMRHMAGRSTSSLSSAAEVGVSSLEADMEEMRRKLFMQSSYQPAFGASLLQASHGQIALLEMHTKTGHQSSAHSQYRSLVAQAQGAEASLRACSSLHKSHIFDRLEQEFSQDVERTLSNAEKATLEFQLDEDSGTRSSQLSMPMVPQIAPPWPADPPPEPKPKAAVDAQRSFMPIPPMAPQIVSPFWPSHPIQEPSKLKEPSNFEEPNQEVNITLTLWIPQQYSKQFVGKEGANLRSICEQVPGVSVNTGPARLTTSEGQELSSTLPVLPIFITGSRDAASKAHDLAVQVLSDIDPSINIVTAAFVPTVKASFKMVFRDGHSCDDMDEWQPVTNESTCRQAAAALGYRGVPNFGFISEKSTTRSRGCYILHEGHFAAPVYFVWNEAVTELGTQKFEAGSGGTIQICQKQAHDDAISTFKPVLRDNGFCDSMNGWRLIANQSECAMAAEHHSFRWKWADGKSGFGIENFTDRTEGCYLFHDKHFSGIVKFIWNRARTGIGTQKIGSGDRGRIQICAREDVREGRDGSTPRGHSQSTDEDVRDGTNGSTPRGHSQPTDADVREGRDSSTPRGHSQSTDEDVRDGPNGSTPRGHSQSTDEDVREGRDGSTPRGHSQSTDQDGQAAGENDQAGEDSRPLGGDDMPAGRKSHTFCSAASEIIAKLGDIKAAHMHPTEDMPSGSTQNCECSSVSRDFIGSIILTCERGILSADTSGCRKDACVSEKAEVVQAYAEAYRGLARLYNDYQGIATSNATQDAVEQEYRSQKDRIADEVHKISTDLEVKVNKLNEISLRLNITRSAHRKLLDHIDSLSQLCDDLAAGRISGDSIPLQEEQDWSLKDIIKEAQGELMVHKPTPAPLETEEDEMKSSGEAPEDISIARGSSSTSEGTGEESFGSSASSGADAGACLWVPVAPCIERFLYEGRSYKGCTTIGSPAKAWCSHKLVLRDGDQYRGDSSWCIRNCTSNTTDGLEPKREEQMVEDIENSVADLRKTVDTIMKTQNSTIAEEQQEVRRWWQSMILWWSVSAGILVLIAAVLAFLICGRLAR